AVELHLPDLPAVPISLGPARSGPRRARLPWHLRLRDLLSAYLPLLLMLLLALGTWWLVKNTPLAPKPRQAPNVRQEPDYTMSRFALERFDASGRLKLRIEGEQLRHLPDTDRIEIDRVLIRAIAPDGRVTLARAQRAVGLGDGSELQLLGGAEVTSVDAAGQPMKMRGEFLHAFLDAGVVRSHLPVSVKAGDNDVQAAGLVYDHGAGRLELQGPMRLSLPPRRPGAAR
ncbi:MAG: LPS export ABC transporter periplasmic protein LptC, partial [Rubrivivax sp.]|nr:LPS export ABC transporter periplasmic protein LptC [Rubrivivax sp.]